MTLTLAGIDEPGSTSNIQFAPTLRPPVDPMPRGKTVIPTEAECRADIARSIISTSVQSGPSEDFAHCSFLILVPPINNGGMPPLWRYTAVCLPVLSYSMWLRRYDFSINSAGGLRSTSWQSPTLAIDNAVHKDDLVNHKVDWTADARGAVLEVACDDPEVT